jgi:hypothetical protein
VKIDAWGLNIEVGLFSLEDNGAVPFSEKNSPSLESSPFAFEGTPSSCESASIRPSRIALATPIPLITATRERLYRFASTMLWEKICFLGVDDSIYALDTKALQNRVDIRETHDLTGTCDL